MAVYEIKADSTRMLAKFFPACGTHAWYWNTQAYFIFVTSYCAILPHIVTLPCYFLEGRQTLLLNAILKTAQCLFHCKTRDFATWCHPVATSNLLWEVWLISTRTLWCCCQPGAHQNRKSHDVRSHFQAVYQVTHCQTSTSRHTSEPHS